MGVGSRHGLLQSSLYLGHAQGMVEPPLLFDLDGTLLDTLGDLADAANAARGHFGLGPVPDVEVAPHIGWGLRRLLTPLLPAELHQSLATARAVFMAHYAENLLKRSVPCPGADALMRTRGSRFIGVVTNKPARFVAPILTHFGWHFDVVITGDTLSQRKPEPAPLLHALEGVGRRGEAIFFGDSDVDHEAALRAGISFVAVAWGRVTDPGVPRIHRLEAALEWGMNTTC